MSHNTSSLTPSVDSASAIAEPAPPAPICKARLPCGENSLRLSAAMKPPPSVMSPTQGPSFSRRITLQTSSTFARSVVVSQWWNANGLCGTVMMMPSSVGSFRSDPGSILLAPHHVADLEHFRALRRCVAVVERERLVRHRDDDAVERGQLPI